MQHAHALEHLERTGLHANGFRILRRLRSVDRRSGSDTAAGQFDGRGQADRACPGDENVGSFAFVDVMHTGDYAARGMVRLRSMSNEAPPDGLHAGHLIARRLRASGIDTVFTLSGGHLFSIYDGCRGRGHPPDRHPPRADRGVRGRRLVEGHPGPGRGGADRRPGRHQRHERDGRRAAESVAAAGARRPRPRDALGAWARCRRSTTCRSWRRWPASPPPRTSPRRGAGDGRRRTAGRRRRTVGCGVRRLPDGSSCSDSDPTTEAPGALARPCRPPTPPTGRRLTGPSTCSRRRSVR